MRKPNPGEQCENCGLRMDNVVAGGVSILYGQGVGQLIITEEGRRFVIKHLVEDVTRDMVAVAAQVVSDPKMQTDDAIYMAARRLLSVAVDIPDRVG